MRAGRLGHGGPWCFKRPALAPQFQFLIMHTLDKSQLSGRHHSQFLKQDGGDQRRGRTEETTDRRRD